MADLNLRKIGNVVAFSLIIAVALIAISVIIGAIVLGSVDTQNKVFDIEVGWPFGWLQISHLTQESPLSIGVSNWVNFIGDFIFYLLAGFAILLGYDIYKDKKPKGKKQKIEKPKVKASLGRKCSILGIVFAFCSLLIFPIVFFPLSIIFGTIAVLKDDVKLGIIAIILGVVFMFLNILLISYFLSQYGFKIVF